MEILLPSAIIEVFQHKVFRMLHKEGLITEERVRLILSWRHTGFHVHNEGRVVANDMEGRERLARYLIRPPVSLERLGVMPLFLKNPEAPGVVGDQVTLTATLLGI